MPVLSLHNTYSLPSGSASYTLGLSGAPNTSSYSYQTSAGVSGIGSNLLTGLGAGAPSSGVSNLVGGLSGLSSSVHPLSNTLPANLGYNPSSAYSNFTNPLLTSTGLKLKPYDDLDLIGSGRYANRALSPSSPIPSANWGLDSYSGLDGVNPAFMHTQRPLSRLGGLELESKSILQTFLSFLFLISIDSKSKILNLQNFIHIKIHEIYFLATTFFLLNKTIQKQFLQFN